jgi:hypothetical protein
MNKLAALSLLLVPACTVSTTPGYQAAPPPPAAAPAAVATPPASAPCIDAGANDVTDLFDQAYPLAASSTTTLCTHRGDVDVFSVTAPPGAAGAVVRIQLTPEVQMAPVVEILDGNRRNDTTIHGKKGEPLAGWAYVAGGTSIFVKVRQVHGVDETYTLTVDSGVLAEAGEPNNELETATPLAIGGSAAGFLARPLNDEAAAIDWYRVELPSAGGFSLDVDMSQGVSSRVTLFDANRKDIARKSGGRGERYQHTFKKLAAGTYFLKIDSMHTLDESGGGALPEALTRAYTITASR